MVNFHSGTQENIVLEFLWRMLLFTNSHFGDIFLGDFEGHGLFDPQQSIDCLWCGVAGITELSGAMIEAGLHHDGGLVGERTDREMVQLYHLQPGRGGREEGREGGREAIC